MTRALKITFLSHAIVAALVGAPLLIAPGRFLGLIGWAPVDPILSRVMGMILAALSVEMVIAGIRDALQAWKA